MKTEIDLRGLTRVQIVDKLMTVSTEQTASLLFEIYYKFVNDMLDVEYLEEVGYQFGVDLRDEYIKKSLEDDEGEEVQ